jgi:hypothetical protein
VVDELLVNDYSMPVLFGWRGRDVECWIGSCLLMDANSLPYFPDQGKL